MIKKLRAWYHSWRCNSLMRSIDQLDKEIAELKRIKAVAFWRYSEHFRKERELNEAAIETQTH